MIDWTTLVVGFDEDNERDLVEFIQQQRWFGGKGKGLSGISLLDCVVVQESPRLALILTEVRYSAGTSDIYQLVLRLDPNDETSAGHLPFVTTVGVTTIREASADPGVIGIVATAPSEGTSRLGIGGSIDFRSLNAMSSIDRDARPVGGEQSNTSVVLNNEMILKFYRRLEAGINPELELLLFLTECGFQHLPPLTGWFSYAGSDLRATLGVAQQFVPNAIDGWSLGLSELTASPDRFLERLARLGEVIGAMHCALASDVSDPDFQPEAPSDETAAILGARLEEHVNQLSAVIPDGRSEELRSLARLLTDLPPSGLLIRTHGDLHLGQLLWSDDDWLVIDFEGEPVRTVAERRQKLHPLRDVAGLLRSISYLAGALQLEHNITVDPEWEETAREKFLTSYRNRMTATELLAEDIRTQDRLIKMFELEKILYELTYEIEHRPDWVGVPLAGIDRLLDA